MARGTAQKRELVLVPAAERPMIEINLNDCPWGELLLWLDVDVSAALERHR